MIPLAVALLLAAPPEPPEFVAGGSAEARPVGKLVSLTPDGAEILTATGKQFVPGLRTVGFGDMQECPPAAGVADLRVVA